MEAAEFPVEHLDLDRLIANLVEVNSRRVEAETFALVDDDKPYWVAQVDQLQAEEDLLNQLIERKRANEKD